MTEAPGDHPAEQPAAPVRPTAEPTAALPPVAPPNPAAPPYAGPPPYDPPQYAQPGSAPYPFTPVARAPREPWINPAKRAAVIITSVVAALVLLFVGAVIGHAATRHHDQVNDRGFTRYQPGPFNQNGNRGNGYPVPGPQRQNRNGPGSVPTPKATPSATTTS